MGISVLSVLQKNIWVNVYRIVINDPFIIGSNMRTCWLHVLESGVVAVRNIIPCHVSKGCEESSKDSRKLDSVPSVLRPSVRPQLIQITIMDAFIVLRGHEWDPLTASNTTLRGGPGRTFDGQRFKAQDSSPTR